MKFFGLKPKNIIGLVVTPAIFLAILIFLDLDPGKPAVTYTFAVVFLMAVWWITEVVPLAVTSLLPVILFPLMGIMDGQDVSSQYFNDVIFLFIGGFIMALAMERWELHRRIALKILSITGVSPGRILFGFMLATAFLSMWMSNTAAAMIIIPILMSVMSKLEENNPSGGLSKYFIGLLLGTAYAATIGGIATLVGTPPNQVLAKQYTIMFPSAPEITFTNWLMFALPVAVITFLFTWIFLYYRYKPVEGAMKGIEQKMLTQYYKELGPISREQKTVLILFFVLTFLWIFRPDIDLGSFKIPGWSRIFHDASFLDDGTVAIAVSFVMFLIPARSGEKIMNWNTAVKLPWDVVLLFGGGFALASGLKESGLAEYFGSQLTFLSDFPIFWVILAISLLICFLSEFASNTATAQMILPVVAALSIAVRVHPILFMFPATLAASLAFMLPVGTPPNAIAYGTGRLRIKDMVGVGIVLDIVCAIILTVLTYYLAPLVFDFELGSFPDWAK